MGWKIKRSEHGLWLRVESWKRGELTDIHEFNQLPAWVITSLIIVFFSLFVFLMIGCASSQEKEIDKAIDIIELCEQYQEPFMCGFEGVDKKAVKVACAFYPRSSACEHRRSL